MWEDMLDPGLFLSRLRPGLGFTQLWTDRVSELSFLASLPLPYVFLVFFKSSHYSGLQWAPRQK